MNRSWFLLPQFRTENRYALFLGCFKAAAFSKDFAVLPQADSF
ncbi:hypothetical protein [Mesorhizobium sp. B2-8-9]|nr:hypothetical protein [Mesorhizobium sp. B2-8-9]